MSLAEHDYLTVRELAALLRLKERKVYDLAASGAVPCSRATGKLLFPAAEIRAWIAASQSGGGAPDLPRPPIVLGSHDPLLDWAIRQSGGGLATYFDGSADGLERFVAGEGVAAGLHIFDAASGTWNLPAVRRVASGQNAVLSFFAARQRGLILRADAAPISGLGDLEGRRIVPRQPGSGTETLFRALAGRTGLDPARLAFAEIARTEDEAVESLRRGAGEVTFGLASVAEINGLAFVPVIEEVFALLVDRRAWFEPGLTAFRAFCRSEKFRARAATLAGYDVSRCGEILWNA